MVFLENITGEWEASVDAKGRLAIPSSLKKLLPEGQKVFKLNRGLDFCIEVYLPESFKIHVEDKYKNLEGLSSDNRHFLRYYVSSAIEVTYDSTERILLPQLLRDYGKITKDVIIVGGFYKFEIWNAEEYKSIYFDLSKFNPSELGEKVLNNLKSKSN
ncbi:MAG: hypothetical protein QM539_01620 [Alphaproteobacteria bacterium]|nr:hypothetical protein [Alphaproteobacteria bacterium]